MGKQCSIILTYFTESWTEADKIKEYLQVHHEYDTNIEAIGDRAWGPEGLQCHAIAMRDWYEAECQMFIVFLQTIDWYNPESVQVYYCPVTDDHYELFRYVNCSDENEAM